MIDLHTHGIGRFDTKTDNPADILKVAELHARAGMSAILPTIYSGLISEMLANIEAVRKAIETQQSEGRGQGVGSKNQATLLGVHLEGPFLNPIRCGALNKDSFIKPSISNLKKLIDGYEDIIKIITVAPEIPGALKIIEECVSKGIRVNMGHSDAIYAQALNGKKAGATGITHIFNAMIPFHHREPGLAGLGLLDEEIYIEVIADGIHLSMETLKLIFKTKNPDRIILVSDSVKSVRKGKPVYSKKGILAGSSITLADSVKNLKRIGISDKIITKVVSENPKRYLRFPSQEKGMDTKN